MRNPLTMGMLALFGMIAVGSTARGDDEPVPLDKVPEAVTKAVKTKFPKAKIEKASKEVEDGKTIYEIEIEENEKDVTVSLKLDGTILEIEKEIAVKDLPAAVAVAIKAKYPRHKIKKAEEVTEGDKVTFEVIVIREGTKPRELTLDKSGKILEDENAEEEDDD